MKHKILMLAGVAIALAGVMMCQNPIPVESEPPELRVVLDSVRYHPATQNTEEEVALYWRGPEDLTSFNYYKIYRTDQLTAEGDFDTATLASDNQRSVVDSNTVAFSDKPGLGNSTYLYAVRAVKLMRRENGHVDTILGLLDQDNMDTVSVGSDVNFNINNGAIFTAARRAELVVNDPARRIQRVRFTQNHHTYLQDTLGQRVEVFFDDPLNPPATEDISALIKGAFLDSRGGLQKSVVRIDKPDFDLADTANLRRTALRANYGQQKIQFPWKLKMGNGTKQVWAEVTYAETNEIDTITDKIEITPYRIQLYYRNKIGTADATMRKQGGTGTTSYYIYKPWIEFSVSIFADPTVAVDFDYWVIASQMLSKVTGYPISATNAWLETRPKHARLTGVGAAHRDDSVYTYYLDPSDSRAAGNLDSLLRTKTAPDTTTAFKLRGPVNDLNYTCAPGSYWGPDPRDWIPAATGTVANLSHSQETIRKSPGGPVPSPQENFDTLKYLTATEARTKGIKEFVLAARFVGREFGDVRPVVSGSEIVPGTYLWGGNGTRSYFDLYPPMMNLDAKATYALKQGDVVSASMLNFAPANEGVTCFSDLGLANIIDLRLIIARKPDDLLFDPAAPPSLTSLLGMRCQIFPFQIKSAASALTNVGWFNIDPSAWPSGEYLMAVVGTDQYGNEGFTAPGSDYPNPWTVTILTGK